MNAKITVYDTDETIKLLDKANSLIKDLKDTVLKLRSIHIDFEIETEKNVVVNENDQTI